MVMKCTCVRVFKILLKISLFSAVFVCIFTFYSYLFRPTSIDRQIISGFYAEKSDTLDAVYIGGSVCFVSWSPLQAYHDKGIASYNYAANTMQADTLIYCIKDVLKTQSPKLLIIDARPFQYRDGEQPPTEVAIRNTSDAMMYSMNRTDMLINIVPSVLHENVFNYLLDIAKYHDLWKNLSKDNFLFSSNAVENRRKGFYFIANKAPVTPPAGNTLVVESVPPRDDTVAILEELLAYCKGIDPKVLFVVAPYCETNADKKVYNYAGKVIKDNGFDFIDFNDFTGQMGLDYNEDLYNKDHLSIYGAKKYTNYLAEIISEKYDLPDRRADSQYDSWLGQFEAWDAEYKTVSFTIEHDMIVRSAPTIYDYLAYLKNERFSVFIAAKDEASSHFNTDIFSLMKNLGFSIDLAGKYRSSYLGVIDQGNVKIDEAANAKLTNNGFLADGTAYSVMSAGYDNGNTCSIMINNVEYAKKSRGLNIVVYDNRISQVIDSVCFDTCAVNLQLIR